MNIFDPLISGSLSVSGSGEISGDLTVLGTINGNISGTTTNAISASHAAAYLLTSSFGAFTSSYTTGSFTGSFGGDGSNLINIPASGVTGLNLTRIADGSVTASVSSASGLRVNSNTEITGALTISGSITLNGVPVGTGKLDEIVFNAYSSSNDTTNSLQNGRLDALEGSTSSLNTFTSSATSRLNTIETTTGSLNTFTSSASDKLIYLESTTSSLNTFTSSANGRLNSLETASGSIITDLNSYTSSNNTVIGTIQTTTSSLNSFTSSANGRLSSLESTTSSLNSYTSSNNNRLGVIETTTGSLNSFTSSASGRLSSLEASSGSIRTDFNTYTSSNDSTNSTQNGKLSALETSSGSLNSFTTSINSKIGSIEISTSSLNSFTSSINTTIKNKLDSDNVISGSIQVSITGTSGFTSFSSSIAAIDSAQDVRLTSIEGITGSYATTGSNIFQGNQVITGSLFVSQDLIIAGSSSIQNISSSVLNIADNIITVNALNPSVRFGGLAVIDSGSSPQVSGSILFDSVNNQWLLVHQNQGTLTSSVLLMGPETYNNIGNETYVTANRLVKSTGIEHLTDSNISDNGTTVTILSNAVVNGTFSATGTTLVSGSSQIDHNATTNYVANRHIDHSSVSISTGAGSGLTGGGDITTTRDLSIATGGVTNAMLAGSIENGKLSNSSFFVGTTSISLGRSSATQTLNGVSIDGNAANVTGVVAVANGGTGASTAANAVTNLGGTTVGGNLFRLTNPSAVTFPRINADNTISTLNAADFRSAIGAGTSSTVGTVTSVGGTGTVSGLSLSGTVTSTGNLTLGGTLTVAASNFSSQTANTFLAAPNGSAGTPTFRTIVAADIPTLNQNTTGNSANVTGIVAIANGGTGASDAATARTNLGITFANVASKPTTLSGYGITDAYPLSGNPSGFITGISFANVSSKPTTISGYGITDAITTGNISSQSVSNASTVANLTPTQFFNNMGDAHGTRTSFDASTPSYNFGFRFVQGNTNGPALGGGGQFYSWYLGLGNDYPATGAGSYGMHVAVARGATTPYMSVRYNENNSLGSWIKIAAGYADSAGSLTSMNISQFTNNSGYATLSGSNSFSNSYNEFGDGTGSVSNDGGWNGRLNIAGSQHARLDVVSVSDGIITTMFSHIGQGVGRVGTYSNHPLSLMVNGSGRASIDTSGHLLPAANGTQNLGSASARWNTLFTSDLSMSNGIGDYTIVEGEEDLFIYNNKTSKVFKFLLQEVDPSIVPPKKV